MVILKCSDIVVILSDIIMMVLIIVAGSLHLIFTCIIVKSIIPLNTLLSYTKKLS